MVVMTDEREPRDYAQLYFDLCDCAGPQPSLNNPRVDEHRSDCPYRAAVAGDGNPCQ